MRRRPLARFTVTLMLVLGCAEAERPAVQGPAAASPAPIAMAPAPAPPASAAVPTVSPPDEPWRKEPPKGAPPAEIKLPEPKLGKLKNGLQVILVESHALPVVAAHLVVFAGAERTGSAQAGLADLTAALLGEGTKAHDAIALSDALDSIGADLSAGASYDAAFVSVNTLRAQLEHALDLFSEVIVTPTFPEAELDRIRQERLTALLQEKDQPAAMSHNAVQRVVYGESHPYAFPLIGLESTLKAFSRADLARFWEKYYRPNNAKLIVVGDTTLGEILPLLEPRFAAWKPRSVAKPSAPRAPRDGAGRHLYLVDKPKASQSVIAVAHVGAARGSTDYIPLLVMNYVLGGSFSSRINMNLRERHGYSYGARSNFSFLRGAGPFGAGGNVRGNVTKESIEELFKELDQIRTAHISDEELGEAKSSIIGKMPSRFETNAAIAGQIADLAVHDLPLDWYGSFTRKVGAVTAADIQRVAQRYVRPKAASIVVVGDRAAIEPTLGPLGGGKLELRGPFGERLP